MTADPWVQSQWAGRINDDVPPAPTPHAPSEALFADAAARTAYWLPEPPGPGFPALQEFWDRMRTGITEYRKLETIPGPRRQVIGVLALRGDDERVAKLSRFGTASRESRSPNWSGAAVAACGGSTLTQVAGSWVEPRAERSGSHTTVHEFRSSVWIGFNGHAAFRDAALPQIGSLQRIVHESQAWITSHWLWFEWWANIRGGEDNPFLLPVYIRLDVAEGDTVLGRIDLVPGDPVKDKLPHVARMCLCVERPATGAAPASKVLVMPFIVHPPELAPREGPIRVMGSKANWIAELPTNIREGPAFLLPRLGSAASPGEGVTFAHCVAGSALEPGAPLSSEHALAVSSRFHIINTQPRGDASLARIARSVTPRLSDTAFRIQVDGNDR